MGGHDDRQPDYVIGTIDYVHPRRRKRAGHGQRVQPEVDESRTKQRRQLRARLEKESFPDRILLRYRESFENPGLVDDFGKIPGWDYPTKIIINNLEEDENPNRDDPNAAFPPSMAATTETRQPSLWRPSLKSLRLVLGAIHNLDAPLRASAASDLKRCLEARRLLQTNSYNRDRREVAIGNARTLLKSESVGVGGGGSLLTNGFILLRHPSLLCSPHPNSGVLHHQWGQWEDDGKIINVHYRELEDLILSSGIVPGATHAFANSFIRRQSAEAEAAVDQHDIATADQDMFCDIFEQLFRESSTGRSPSTAAHNDFTSDYGSALRKSIRTGVPHTQTFGFEEAMRERIAGSSSSAAEDLLRDSRVLVLNTWRSVTPGPMPLERDPIVLCDRRTIHPNSVHTTTGTRRTDTGKKAPYEGPPPDPSVPPIKDVPSIQSDCFRAGTRGGGVDSIPSGEPGGGLDAYYGKYDPRHRWYYYPRMTRDEVVVWVGYDSDPPSQSAPSWKLAGHPTLAGSTLHTSFVPPDAPPGSEGRRSIDIRVLVLVPKKKVGEETATMAFSRSKL